MSAPTETLAASRVDLIERIRAGIPEPAHVPGCAPWLRTGKRYLIPAPAGTGKSLALLVIAVTVVEHGGCVVILDVENGADEYARRLADILDARDQDGTLADACRERLRYHDWPRFSLAWKPEQWSEAIDAADLVIFDSSRLALSSVGLAEDSNDDYSRFISALVVPLARAGTTTIIADNTGHNDSDRARGASSKADLNEVVYTLKAGAPFDRDRAGHLRLTRTRSRFSGLPHELHLHVGGATYTAPVVADTQHITTGFRPTRLMEKASRVIEETPGLTRNAIITALGGKKDYAVQAIAILVAERYVTVRQERHGNLHHSAKPYRAPDEPDRVPGSQLGPDWVRDPLLPLGPTGSPPIGDPAQDPPNGTHPLGPTAEELARRVRALAALPDDEAQLEYQRLEAFIAEDALPAAASR